MKESNKTFIFHKQLSFIVRAIISFLMPFIDVYFYILLFIVNIKRKRTYTVKKYNLSLCAIFKNESVSLKEWIEYHLLIGVEHFYLYNNLSNDNYLEIIEPYVKSGLVDLIDWPVPPPSQFPAYEDCFKKYRSDSQWIAFIDLDEFICPIKEVSLNTWLEKYVKYPSIVVYWKMFGTSGLIEHDNSKLIIEQYNVCWEKYYDIGKCFFNTDFDVYKFSQHHFLSAKVDVFKKSFMIAPINEFKKFVVLKNNRTRKFSRNNEFTIQINHYSSRAYSSCIKDKFLTRGDVNNHERNAYTFFWHEHKNTSVDYKIWRFLIELKVRMGHVNHLPEIVEFTNSKQKYSDV